MCLCEQYSNIKSVFYSSTSRAKKLIQNEDTNVQKRKKLVKKTINYNKLLTKKIITVTRKQDLSKK